MHNLSPIDRQLKTFVDGLVRTDNYKIIPGINIKRSFNTSNDDRLEESCETSRKTKSLDDYFKDRLVRYARSHHIAVNVPETARFLSRKYSDFLKLMFIIARTCYINIYFQIYY